MSNSVENLKIATGASKAPVGIVPLHPLLGMSRVLEDSGVKYAPFNYMVQSIADACEAYTSAELRHHIQSTLLGGQVTPESLATLDEDSGLPHIFHRITGLFILATLMIRDGVIAADPGQGKRKRASLCADGGECTTEGDANAANAALGLTPDTPDVLSVCFQCPGPGSGTCCRDEYDPDAERRRAAEAALKALPLVSSLPQMTTHHDPKASNR